MLGRVPITAYASRIRMASTGASSLKVNEALSPFEGKQCNDTKGTSDVPAAITPMSYRHPPEVWVEEITLHTSREHGYEFPIPLSGFTLPASQADALGRLISALNIKQQYPSDTFSLQILKNDRNNIVKEMLLLTYRDPYNTAHPLVLLSTDRGIISTTQYRLSYDENGCLYTRDNNRYCVGEVKNYGRLVLNISSGKIWQRGPSGKLFDFIFYPWTKERRFTREQVLSEHVDHGPIDLLAGK